MFCIEKHKGEDYILLAVVNYNIIAVNGIGCQFS